MTPAPPSGRSLGGRAWLAPLRDAHTSPSLPTGPSPATGTHLVGRPRRSVVSLTLGGEEGRQFGSTDRPDIRPPIESDPARGRPRDAGARGVRSAADRRGRRSRGHRRPRDFGREPTVAPTGFEPVGGPVRLRVSGGMRERWKGPRGSSRGRDEFSERHLGVPPSLGDLPEDDFRPRQCDEDADGTVGTSCDL